MEPPPAPVHRVLERRPSSLLDAPELHEAVNERIAAEAGVSVCATGPEELLDVGGHPEAVRVDLLAYRRRRLVVEQADHLVHRVVRIPVLVRARVRGDNRVGTEHQLLDRTTA